MREWSFWNVRREKLGMEDLRKKNSTAISELQVIPDWN
jgi:hypothetical protein